LLAKDESVSSRERARREARRSDISEIAERLQEILGQRIVAFAVGVRDPRIIGSYARAERMPRKATDERLRHLYEITQMLLTRETPETTRAWLLGSHPLLEDMAPLELLHNDDQPATNAEQPDARPGYESVVALAEEFVGV
jgi:hypothetical protein